MNWFAAALLGVVQGLTEFLPVSSTAHLLIGARILGFDDPGGIFTVMIQLGSILAVMWLYRAKIVQVLLAFPSDPGARRFVFAVLLAFAPAVGAGVLFGDFVKRALYTTPAVIGVTFIAGGIVMLVVERYRGTPHVRQADETSLGRAFGIGLCQVLAMVPGVSRSGATMVGGMVMGLDRQAAAEFSFFLAMPTMTAAFAHDFWTVRHDLSAGRAEEIAIGFVMAFVASALVVKPFLSVVRRVGFGPFAWYRIGAGVLILAALTAGRL